MLARNSYPAINLYIIYFIFAFIAIYFIYAPLINIPFYHHDIYKFSVGSFQKLCSDDYGSENMLAQSRPFHYLLDCKNFKFANTLQHMSDVRFTCVIFLALFASIVAAWLFKSGFAKWNAVLISVIICCFPGAQTTMIMGVDTHIFAPVMGLLAYLLVDKGFRKNDKKSRWGYIATGIIFLLISLFTYPGLASIFLVPTFSLLLFKPLSEWPLTRRIIIRDVAIFLVSTVLFFLIAKCTQKLLMPADYPANYVYNINFYVWDRLWGLVEIFPSLWQIEYHRVLQAIVVFGVVIAGISIATRSFEQKSNLKLMFQVSAAGFVLLMLGALTYLMQPSNMLFGRILFVYQVMAFLVFVWALMQIFAKFPDRSNTFLFATLIAIFFLSGSGANAIVTRSALNDHMELTYLTQYLGNHIIHKDKIKRIHIVGLKPDSTDNFNGGKPRDDIFNINSTFYRQDSFYMVDAALKQLLILGSYTLYNCVLDEFQLMHVTEKQCLAAAPSNSIIVTYSRQGEPILKSPHTLIVNLSPDEIHFPDNPKLSLEKVDK